MKNFILNGVMQTLSSEMTLKELLDREGFGGMTVAVAHNETFIPRSHYTSFIIQHNDRIDIVSPMQGG
jgi:sulfur carrier protein